MQYIILRKKIIRNMFSTIFAIFICFLLALSSYTYYATRTAILNSISDQNSSLSAQADTFTQQYYKMVRNYGINVFYSRDITRLRSGTDVDNSEYIESMRELRTYASSTDYIHSIYIYNGNEDYIYCTLDADLNKGSDSSDAFFDSEAVEMLKCEYISAPVLRHINIYGKDVNVISFLFYEFSDSTVKSSMMVNVSLNWMEEFLPSILGLEDTSLYLGTGEALLEHPEAAQFFAGSGDILERLLDGSNNDSYLIHKFNGERYICFCAHNQQLDWYFIRVIEYDTCLRAALSMRLTLVVITGILALIAAAVGIQLFKKFFTPIERLLETLPTDSIDNSISTVGQALSHASNELKTQSEIIKSEFLKKLLLFSSADCTQQMLRAKEIRLAVNKSVHLMLVGAAVGPYDVNDVMKDCACEIVEINGCHVIISQGDKTAFIRQARLLGHCSSFCAYDCDRRFSELHEAFERLNEIYRLRFFLPKQETYTTEVLEGRGETQYPHRLESRLTGALMLGNSEKAMQLLDEFVQTVCPSSTYACMHSHFKQLYISVCELDRDDHPDMAGCAREYESAIKAVQTSDDLTAIFDRLFKSVADKNVKARELEEAELIRRVKGHISERYSDINLSSVYIADLEGVSNAYLCELFKKYEENTIPKYITQYRLERSCELLRTTNMPVTAIAKAVGFTTPQYFFTVFKSYYNMTPAKYRE